MQDQHDEQGSLIVRYLYALYGKGQHQMFTSAISSNTEYFEAMGYDTLEAYLKSIKMREERPFSFLSSEHSVATQGRGKVNESTRRRNALLPIAVFSLFDISFNNGEGKHLRC